MSWQRTPLVNYYGPASKVALAGVEPYPLSRGSAREAHVTCSECVKGRKVHRF